MNARAAATITAIIVDDEQLACDELRYLLKEYADLELLATAHNGLEALKLIEDLEPDIAFLDVQMPGLDGLGVIRKLKEKNIPLPYFVLATAYDQYALEAFRLEALDYLLKPIEKERLAVTLERARKAVSDKAGKEALAVPAPKASGPQRTKLLVRSNNRNLI